MTQRHEAGMAASHDDALVKLPRVTLDLKVPLWSIASAACVMVTGLVGMYYQLDQVGKDVVELKATLRAVNAETIKFAREQAVLEFRVQKLEQAR